MEHPQIGLNGLGWNDWFKNRAECRAEDTVARVAAVDRSQLLLIDQTGSFPAKLAGSYLYHHLPQEHPCVGDWVCVEKHDDFGLIHSIAERRTLLRRKSAGNSNDSQMIAANVDYVIIVQSCHYDFSVNRLERYLVMVRDGGAEPCILLTKTDLITPDILDAQLEEITAAGITAPVLTLSNVTQAGIAELTQRLLPGKTYCFVGSSGVGKSTLINHLIGQVVQETSWVSGTGEGRHTTVRRELIILPSGALVIDNPGMREFGILGADSGIGGSFSDIITLGAKCRFRNCNHTSEPGCAIVEAVDSGAISRSQYDNFIKLRDESAYHQLSYAEKRKKDRDFGRYIKSAKKELNDD
jgi:ribosome biogenesis GTPase